MSRVLEARPAAVAAGMVTTPAPRDEWRRVLDDDPDALVTQSPQWLDAMTSSGRYVDASRLYAYADGRRFVLPMVARSGHSARLVGAASNLDAWGAGGLVGKGVDGRVVADVFSDLGRSGYWRVRVRPNPLHAVHYAPAVPHGAFTIQRRAHAIELPSDAAVAWNDLLSSACRRSIRKAEQSNVDVVVDTSGRFASVFHELLMRSVDRWARQQHEPRPLARWRAARRDPLQKWETIARNVDGACQFRVALHEGTPVAASIVLRGANAHYTRGAMDKERSGPLRASHLLMWHAIRDAIANGCRYFHMGETGGSESLARFKEQFGAAPFDYADYVLERLPISRADAAARRMVKKAIRFRDT